MRRVVNIFYQCVIGVETILLALAIYGMCQAWHIRMMFAVISQEFADGSSLTAKDENEKMKAKEDLLESDKHILAVAQRKPFIAIMSADEDAAVKKAKTDLGLSQ
jgi:uncharacterized protein with GYD domain